MQDQHHSVRLLIQFELNRFVTWVKASVWGINEDDGWVNARSVPLCQRRCWIVTETLLGRHNAWNDEYKRTDEATHGETALE